MIRTMFRFLMLTVTGWLTFASPVQANEYPAASADIVRLHAEIAEDSVAKRLAVFLPVSEGALTPGDAPGLAQLERPRSPDLRLDYAKSIGLTLALFLNEKCPRPA